MDIIYFSSGKDFHAWLTKNHTSSTELLLGFYKKDSKKKGITYQEALDEALCFGWIDGIRKRVDEDSFTIRFTPRKKNSIWSNVNTKRVTELKNEGRMKPSGLAAFALKQKAGIYAFENKQVVLDAKSLKQFKSYSKAWTYFQSQAPWYQRTAIHWVMAAKRQETKEKRLAQLVADSSQQRRLKQLSRD